MSFFGKLNEKLFGNVSSKISVLTKILVVVFAILGVIFVVAGAVQALTYASFGLGDEDVVAGITYIFYGLLMIVGGYWLGMVVLGFNKIVEEYEESAFGDFECEGCSSYESEDGFGEDLPEDFEEESLDDVDEPTEDEEGI